MTTVHRTPGRRDPGRLQGRPGGGARLRQCWPPTRPPWPGRASAPRNSPATATGCSPSPRPTGTRAADRRTWSAGCGCSAWSPSLDPPRPAAAATIAACQAAGITPVLITGDHPATARAIAAELGIIAPRRRTWSTAATPARRRLADCRGPGVRPRHPRAEARHHPGPQRRRRRGRDDRRRGQRRARPAPRRHRRGHGQTRHRGRPPGRRPGPRRRRPRHRRRRRRGRPPGLRQHPPVPALRPGRRQRRDRGHARRPVPRPAAAAAAGPDPVDQPAHPRPARGGARQRTRRPRHHATPAPRHPPKASSAPACGSASCASAW